MYLRYVHNSSKISLEIKHTSHHATIYLQISTHRISRTSKDSLRIRYLILLTLWRHDVSQKKKYTRSSSHGGSECIEGNVAREYCLLLRPRCVATLASQRPTILASYWSRWFTQHVIFIFIFSNFSRKSFVIISITIDIYEMAEYICLINFETIKNYYILYYFQLISKNI